MPGIGMRCRDIEAVRCIPLSGVTMVIAAGNGSGLLASKSGQRQVIRSGFGFEQTSIWMRRIYRSGFYSVQASILIKPLF
jgi:hypothetical protein